MIPQQLAHKNKNSYSNQMESSSTMPDQLMAQCSLPSAHSYRNEQNQRQIQWSKSNNSLTTQQHKILPCSRTGNRKSDMILAVHSDAKAMDMRFHWLRNRAIAQNQFNFFWRPGPSNYADYWTKHHPPAHHKNMRKEFLTPYSVREPHHLFLFGKRKDQNPSKCRSSTRWQHGPCTLPLRHDSFSHIARTVIRKERHWNDRIRHRKWQHL